METETQITLRDYFAGLALQGIMHSWGETEGCEANVKWAYIYADGMMEQRKKEIKP